MSAYCPICQRCLPRAWTKAVWLGPFECGCGARITTFLSPYWLVMIGGAWPVLLTQAFAGEPWDAWTRAMIAGISSGAIAGIAHVVIYRPRLSRPKSESNGVSPLIRRR